MSANSDMAAETKRAEWTFHVATTAAQQVKSAGRIPTAPLLIKVLVPVGKTCESLWHLLWHMRETQARGNTPKQTPSV